MRVLELRTASLDFELHPLITLVRGLDVDARTELAQLIGGIVRGVVPNDVSGLAEAHGILFGLTSGSIASLGLPPDVDAVVRPADLTGVVHGGPTTVERQAESRIAQLEVERVSAADEVETARAALAALHDDIAAAEARMAEASDVLARVEREREERLAREAAIAQDAAAAEAEREASLHALAERRAVLEGQYRNEMAAARARVERARDEVASVERSGDHLLLDQEAIAQLEAAHAEVEEAEERTGRIPNPLAQRRLRAAREREQEVLARLGLPSYGAYLIRTSTMNVDPDAARRLLQARAELAEAEEALAEIEGAEPAELTEILRQEAALRGEPVGDAGAAERDDTALARSALSDAEQALASAREREEATKRRVRDLERRMAELDDSLDEARANLASTVAEREAREAAGEAPAEPSAEDIEVFLLAKLAGLRSAGCTGAGVVVIDDALAALGDEARGRVLALLGRIADAMQTIYLTDSPEIVSWAESLGPDRCLVIGPS